jgi:hypothetical protein
MTEAAETEVLSLGPETAAEALFADPYAEFDYEPADSAEARAVVEYFGHLFETAPGVLKAAIEGARAGAETLSVDRLQGLAEIIQNADDAEARQVEFRIVGDVLVASHDGQPVALRDVLGLATPWLTMKAQDVYATGRFGIGLVTLRSLSDVLDVHSGPYHMRFGTPTITAIEPPAFLEAIDPSATVLCVPLKPAVLDTAGLDEWLGHWDDSALLFCRHVQRVTVLDLDGTMVRTLALSWSDEPSATCVVGGAELPVTRRHARSSDGRGWLVHSVDAPAPPGEHRAWKATGDSVPLAIGLPLEPDATGFVYAGLPIVGLRTPVRVNAQFDPITNRRDLANTEWNTAMLPLVADLWVETVDDLFTEQPSAGWLVVPLPAADDAHDDPTSIARRLDAIFLERARRQLVDRVTFTVGDEVYPLGSLALETERLEDLLSTEEVAYLAELPAALSHNVRDDGGRWREVLDDWRTAGANLPWPVSVHDALRLLCDPARSAEATLALTAAGLESGLATRLAALPCIVTEDDGRIAPPSSNSLLALAISASPLAQELGLELPLHSAYLADNDDARRVLEWLRGRGALIDDADPETVVRRLAAAGSAGHRVPAPLTDPQAQALRDAMEHMRGDERADLGPDIGAAITLAAFTYDARGRKVTTNARPVDAYLPAVIDRDPDSFAHAADTTPGLLWLHSRYADVLRSSLDRSSGLGAQKFLRLLGAEVAPRLVPHPGLTNRYQSDRRWGLGIAANGSARERGQALRAAGATYTLDDLDSPDLRAVTSHIAREKKVKQRRKRAAALLGTLGRGWDRLGSHAYVAAADTDYTWRTKGEIRAFWLWSAGSTAWLDDADGRAQRPLDLRLRTVGTIAVHGADAQGYLRSEFDLLNRREVLAALGVTGEPSARSLVERLIELRESAPDNPPLAADVALVYEALAEGITSRTSVPGDLSDRDLRSAFASHGLVRTQVGWHPPNRVLAGPPVFGTHRPFVPQVPNAERLWSTLQIRYPSLEDCLSLLQELARTRSALEGTDQSVLLGTLRLLAERLGGVRRTPQLNRRLAKSALWTTQGWMTDRPVYAVDDPTLVDGLSSHVPVWLPGGELSQFTGLLEPLRILRLAPDATTVVDGDATAHDADATEILRAAVPLLHEDLVRNDPATAESLRLTWERLATFEVRIDGELRVSVGGIGERQWIEIHVDAKADMAHEVLYLREPRVLRQVEGGGRAIASLFAADQRLISQAWLAACVAVEEGRVAQEMELARERAEEERTRTESEMAERLAEFQQGTATRHATRPRRPTAEQPGGRGLATPTPTGPPTPPPRPRVLVDPDSLIVADPHGRRGGTGGSTRQPSVRRRGSRPLSDPDHNVAPPRGSARPAGFTQLDAESVGYECFLRVMASDREGIVDLRAQHGVGADAVDSLDRSFYELKVYRQDEPDTIQLQESQIRRALATRNFFLVIVSNIEGANAHPKVRVIVEPLNQLPMTNASSVTLSGIRSAEYSQIYDLVPSDEPG